MEATAEIRPNFVHVATTLTSYDFRSTVANLSTAALIQLSLCCRALRNKICEDHTLWQRLYRKQFLNNSLVRKERDFLYWCARNYCNNNDTSANPSVLLNSINWYKIYCQRTGIEYNWRHGHSKQTDTLLPGPVLVKNWNIDKDCATAFLLVDNNTKLDRQYFSFALVVETTPFISNNHFSSNNATSPTPSCLSLVQLESPNEAMKLHQTNIVLSNEYAISTICYSNLSSNKMNIYNRSLLELQRSNEIPKGFSIKSTMGQWVLLYRFYSRECWAQTNIIVWDLKRNGHYNKSIDGDWPIICFQYTDEDVAIVYIANRGLYTSNDIQWTLHQFSAHKPVRELKKGTFCPLTRNTQYCMATPLGLSHILVATIHNKRRILIHSVASNEDTAPVLDTFQVPSNQVASVLLSHGIDYQKHDILWMQQEVDPICYRQFAWPNAVKCQHIIGSICNGNTRITLIDIRTGEAIRQLGVYSGKYMLDFIMPSMTIVNETNNKMKIINYGIL
ncbi:hypothetical protein BDF19DRAFT_444948 [Syncephalis fuscata]|nr:hypothetical protein BDF19DRAFT_444948 [Syncephalis fuscata]